MEEVQPLSGVTEGNDEKRQSEQQDFVPRIYLGTSGRHSYGTFDTKLWREVAHTDISHTFTKQPTNLLTL
jgi:hypothetical protein